MVMRCHRKDAAIEIMKQYVNTYPSASALLKVQNGTQVRGIYEAALSELEPEEVTSRVFRQFESFEECHGQYDRARASYISMPLIYLIYVSWMQPTDNGRMHKNMNSDKMKSRASM
jgi:hypothetical protein